jgi:hypothetical protein
MKRSEFLKKLGIGFGVAVVAPSVLAKIQPNDAEPVFYLDDEVGKTAPYKVKYLEPARLYPLTYKECYPPDFFCVGDEFVRNGNHFICVAINYGSNSNNIYTLRPIDEGDDIDIWEGNLGYFRYTGFHHLMERHA